MVERIYQIESSFMTNEFLIPMTSLTEIASEMNNDFKIVFISYEALFVDEFNRTITPNYLKCLMM